MSQSIADPNQALIHYLDRYCSSEVNPGYAVLIRGPWGSGKTWFVEKYRKNLAVAKRRSLYVSLFGCRSPADITDQFFVQIHPRLGNKHVQKGWSVIKGMFKLGLKVDLDQDGKDDASLQVDLRDLGMWASTQGAILIFDDLERASMPIKDVLGFINQFVEHDGYRVLLLANESEQSFQSPKYLRIKEKVIGRTFEVHPDVEAAFETFVSELSDERAHNTIRTRRDLVLTVMHRAQHGNLRHLRQAIFDFADLLSCLGSQPAEENSTFIDRLVEDVVTFSIELRAGTITEADIRKIGNTNWNRYFAKDRNDENSKSALSIAEQALNRHGVDEFVTLALLPAAYAQFFSTGYLPPIAASEALLNSPYLANEKTATWRRLWYLRALRDDDFSELVEDVYTKLNRLEYRDEGELLHAAALVIFLTSKGLTGRTTKQVVLRLQRIVAQMCDMNLLDAGPRGSVRNDNLRDMSAYGLGFIDKDSQAFKEFVAFYSEKQSVVRSKKLREWAQEWMLLLEKDTFRWAAHLLPGEDRDQRWFVDEPVFKFVSPFKCAGVLIKLHTPDLDHVRTAFSGRFESMHAGSSWKLEELPFLQKLVLYLEKSAKLKRNGAQPLSAFILKSSVLPTLRKAIERLETFRLDHAG